MYQNLGENRSLSQEISSKQHQIDGLSTNLDEFTKKNEALQESLDKLKADSQNELSAIQKEAIQLYNNVTMTKESFEPPSLNEVFSQLNEKCTEMIEKNRNLSSEVETLSSEVSTKQQIIEELSTNLDEFARKNETMQEFLNKLKEDNQALNGLRSEFSVIQQEAIHLYKNLNTSNESVEPPSLNEIFFQLNEKCTRKIKICRKKSHQNKSKLMA